MLVIMIYGAAMVGGAMAYLYCESLDLIFRILIADIAATCMVFGASYALNNSSLYDPYWSVAPIVIAGFILSLPETPDPRFMIAFSLTALWGIRLTRNWLKTWEGLGTEDWRYQSLAVQTGRGYWWVSFLGIHLFPTLLVFLGCLSFFTLNEANPSPLNLLDLLAVITTLGSILIEHRADAELHKFRASRCDRSQVLDTGLWARCRHPNYLGEIGFWFGLYLFSVAASFEPFQIGLIGPVAMVTLFVGISIPMIEKKLLEDKPNYSHYRATTPMLIPYGKL